MDKYYNEMQQIELQKLTILKFTVTARVRVNRCNPSDTYGIRSIYGYGYGLGYNRSIRLGCEETVVYVEITCWKWLRKLTHVERIEISNNYVFTGKMYSERFGYGA